MFVELENGELLNLNHVVKIFIEKQNVIAEYASGDNVRRFATIHRGTEHECNHVLTTLKNSLDVVFHRSI